MKVLSSIVILVALVSVSVPALALGPVNYWSANYGGVSNDLAEAVAIDPDGNVYVVGQYQGLGYFGGVVFGNAGGDDIFIAKYDPTGAHVWSKAFGGTSADQARAVAVDYLGNVIVAGFFNNSINFGGGLITSNGSQDIFLVKLDSNGNHVWSSGFGGTSNDQPNGLAVDAGANIVMTGIFQNTVNFGGGNLVSAGVGDVFVAKYTAAGGHTWSQRFGSTGNDYGTGIGVDALSRIVVTGQFAGTVDFGGGGVTSNGSFDVFLAKFGITGTHIWSQGFGSNTGESAGSLDVAPDGNIAITGSFQNTADFGGTAIVSNGGTDTYLASYNEDGTHRWSRGFGSASSDDGIGVRIDGGGNVFLTAWFYNSVDFGGGPIGEDSGSDTMLGKYAPDGDHVWSGSFDASNFVNPRGLAIDADSKPAIVGYFSGTVEFGAGVLISANNDLFVAGFGPPAGAIVTSITDIGNDQGRKVKIRFDRSGHDDVLSSTPVLAYDVYRRNDPPAGWTYLASAPAHGESSYGIDVSTLADSTVAEGQFWSAFFIRASTDAPTVFWDSTPDSGYSLDNLAPGVPMMMAFTAGVVSWTAPADADLDHFTVYGADVDDFGSAVVVDYTTGESLDVSTSPYAHYFVTATDAAGNEGAPARLEAPSGAGGMPARYVLSVGNYPNPFNPSTRVRYTVPSDGAVSIVIYNVRGARVATLVDDPAHKAGAWDVPWNGVDDAGAGMPSGVYFARITHNGITRAKKLSLLK